MVVSAHANPEWDSLRSRHHCFIAVVDLSGLDSDFVSAIGSVRVHGDDETYIVDDCLCACCVRASALVNSPTGGQIQPAHCQVRFRARAVIQILHAHSILQHDFIAFFLLHRILNSVSSIRDVLIKVRSREIIGSEVVIRDRRGVAGIIGQIDAWIILIFLAVV